MNLDQLVQRSTTTAPRPVDPAVADANASAVAGLLSCAETVTRFAPDTPVVFAAFNCEETNLDRSGGLAGSIDFARKCVKTRVFDIRRAHVFEMIGYCDHAPGSQH